jgi:hypothetical protein
VIQYVSNFKFKEAAYVKGGKPPAMIDDGGVWPATSIIAR